METGKKTDKIITLFDRSRDNIVSVIENENGNKTHLLFDHPYTMMHSPGVSEIYNKIEGKFDDIVQDGILCTIISNRYTIDFGEFIGGESLSPARYYYEYDTVANTLDLINVWSKEDVELGNLGILGIIERNGFKNTSTKEKTTSASISLEEGGIVATYRGSRFTDLIFPILDEKGTVGSFRANEKTDKVKILSVLMPELVWITTLKKGMNKITCTKLSGQEPGYYHVSRVESPDSTISVSVRRTHNE